MGKQFKGKTCVYCGRPSVSEDGDHVLCRQFVLPKRRDHLPKVPACSQCNNEKSKLEHYLTSVMPFGGRHADAQEVLSSMVPPRLEKNRRLRDSLTLFRSAIYTSHNNGPWVRQMSLPFDGDRLLRLAEMMVKGLAFYHWEFTFDQTDVIRSTLLTRHGRRFVDPFFNAKGGRRIAESIADGALAYEAVEVRDVPRASLWRLSLYGANMSGGGRFDLPESTIYVFTSPADAVGVVRFIDEVTL